MGDLLTTREAAIYLSNRLNEKINRGRLDVWRMRDQGPPYKSIGRRIYYDLDDLEEWIDEHSLWIKNNRSRAAEERLSELEKNLFAQYTGITALTIAITNSPYKLNERFHNEDEEIRYEKIYNYLIAMAKMGGRLKLRDGIPQINLQDARDACIGIFANEKDAHKFMQYYGLLEEASPNKSANDNVSCEEDLTPPADLNPDLLFTQ